MPKENRQQYWIKRFEVDGILLNNVQKTDLVRGVLTDYVALDEADLQLFLDPHFPTHCTPDDLIRYSSLESRIGTVFNGVIGGKQVRKWNETRFYQAFRDSLQDIYSPEEMEEIFSFSKPRQGDEWYITLLLAGRLHYGVRRIRNSYLPGMTDLVINGQVRNDLLFDGPEDTVEQIEKLLDIN